MDQQLLLEGKRLPLSDEESLPLEKNRYTCFVAPADKSSSYKAKGVGVRTEIVERLRRENRKEPAPYYEQALLILDYRLLWSLAIMHTLCNHWVGNERGGVHFSHA